MLDLDLDLMSMKSRDTEVQVGAITRCSSFPKCQSKCHANLMLPLMQSQQSDAASDAIAARARRGFGLCPSKSRLSLLVRGDSNKRSELSLCSELDQKQSALL